MVLTLLIVGAMVIVNAIAGNNSSSVQDPTPHVERPLTSPLSDITPSGSLQAAAQQTGLLVVDSKACMEGNMRAVVGHVKNTSTTWMYNSVSVRLDLFDSNHHPAGQAVAYDMQLMPGATWEFHIWGIASNATYYSFEPVAGTAQPALQSPPSQPVSAGPLLPAPNPVPAPPRNNPPPDYTPPSSAPQPTASPGPAGDQSSYPDQTPPPAAPPPASANSDAIPEAPVIRTDVGPNGGAAPPPASAPPGP